MNSNVSLIIPTYNRCLFVKEALASVYSQTIVPSEVIVVDDGSTDDTSHIIPQAFPEVIYIRQTNQGVSSARNAGIKKAKGEWICFLDSDDTWTPTKLEDQLRETTQQGSLISYTNEIWYRNGKRVNPRKKHQKYSGDLFEKCLALCIISASSVLIHRSVFEKVGLFKESLPACEDYDLWLRISARFPILFLPKVFIVKQNGVDTLHLSQQFWGMDRFRIQALRELGNDKCLKEEQKKELNLELTKKLHVYQRGALKRGNFPPPYHI